MTNMSKKNGAAKLIRNAKVIIWDEGPMAKRQTIETVDRRFRDIMDIDKPFGGKVIVFGGYFCQMLPVVPKSTRAEIVNASLVKSYLSPLMENIQFTRNMRAKTDSTFIEFLLFVEKLSISARNGDPIDHPPLKMMMLRDNLISFSKLKGESVYEFWQTFKPFLQRCPTHGIPDKMPLECLYPESEEGLRDESRSGKVVEKCRLASKGSSRCNAEEVGDPDPDLRLTQDNFTLESVKVGEPRKLLLNRRPVVQTFLADTPLAAPSRSGTVIFTEERIKSEEKGSSRCIPRIPRSSTMSSNDPEHEDAEARANHRVDRRLMTPKDPLQHQSEKTINTSRRGKVVEKCILAIKVSSRRIAEKFSDPDPDCSWTQDNFTLESIKAFLADTPLAAPSRSGTVVSSEATPGTDTQDQSDAPGTDANTNRATV
ncbi:uncharacterized protein LOC125837808 [Solanum verrucosum]|uniref:uncharacterized protein LOC125837808 n=1 Tax=Solanum verrucosum TaxID=315347 RepID=UPI0020D126AE|nr:uncharacterized protein LOC125837808 [Solanum verrucosum]